MFKLIYRKFGNRMHAKDDILSGLTVALALVPEAVAFCDYCRGLPDHWAVCRLYDLFNHGGTRGPAWYDIWSHWCPCSNHGIPGYPWK